MRQGYPIDAITGTMIAMEIKKEGRRLEEGQEEKEVRDYAEGVEAYKPQVAGRS